MDDAKTKTIGILITNLGPGSSITVKQFADIIDTVTMDAAKKSVSAELLPLIK
jgi:hypothetical protein